MALKRNPITGIPPRSVRQQSQQTEMENETEGEFENPVGSPDDQYDKIINDSKESSTLEPGRYEAIVDEIVSLPLKETGGFIRATFIIADPDERLMGRKHVVLFQMLQDDGRTRGEWGPMFYHRMMAKLGYARDNRGREARDEIGAQKPAVWLKITAGKQEGFVNTAVEGRQEEDSENIEALRDWLQTNPF